MRKVHGAIVVAGVALGMACPLAAQTVGLGFGDGIEIVTEHDAIIDGNVYDIEGPNAHFDPNAGAWQKILNAPANGFQPGQIYTVVERITFFPPPPDSVTRFPISDWHETIELGAGMQLWDIWTTDHRLPNIGLDPSPGAPPLPGLTFGISPDGSEIWFEFDPILPPPGGLTLHITKDFRYVGSTVSFDPVIITQYPTPAPATLALLGLAGIVVCQRKR